jgi:hypothetical protein
MHTSILILLAAFLALQVADAVTTYLGLHGSPTSISEGNPAARWVFQRLGLVPTIVALKAAMSGLGVALALAGGMFSLGALGVLTAVGIYVLVNNVRVLRQAS